ncbi:Mobile element protein, partial [hydrothermal vent metagenome]
NYEHRRQWLEDRLHEASAAFAIDVCTYSIMSNHYHVVLHMNIEQAQGWSMDEVIKRWHQLYGGFALSQRYLRGATLGKAELATLNERAEIWRERLMNVSWLMRTVNERIARQANAEDNCTGRFWEGRFKSQALLDEAALAACMVYVDLNPVRAGMAATPESSDHTSIQKRIQSILNTEQPDHKTLQPQCLYPFVGNPRENMPDGLPFKLEEYIELVDLTGRQIREGKKGRIDATELPILQRLNMENDNWKALTQYFEKNSKGLVGSVFRLKIACEKLGYQRTVCKQSCEQFFS